MGSMLPYIAYMDPMGRELVATIYPYGGFLSHGAYPQFGSRLNAPKLVKKNREDGEMSKCQPGFYPVNTEKNDGKIHHILWVNQLFRLGHFIIFNSKLLNYQRLLGYSLFLNP